MAGAISLIAHGGFKSELLAQHVFSSWGTVVATPNPQDYGIDLYCNLVEKVGNRAWARAPFTVQVKSNMDPWVFEGMESVRWLIEHPLPLFLCVVEKQRASVRVYHTSPRFYVWSLGHSPDRLSLRPTTDEIGFCTSWEGSFDFSLGAPIIQLTMEQLLDDTEMIKAREVLELWIEVENTNLNLLRSGLMRFKMLHEYKTNNTFSTWAEQGLTEPTDEQLQKGILHLAEALDCLGSQFFYRSDCPGATKMALVYRHIFKKFRKFFNGLDSPRALTFLYKKLNLQRGLLPEDGIYSGVDQIDQELDRIIASDMGQAQE